VARIVQTTFTLAGTLAFKVLRFQESHKLGVPASLEIDCAFLEYQELDSMIGQKASLSYGYEGEDPRTFAGVVESATLKGSSWTASWTAGSSRRRT
jgi:hypothetical protein